MPGHEQLGAVVFALLPLLVGSALVIWAGRRVWFAQRSRHWPHADGVVTCSEVREDADSDGDVWFAPHVEYSFEVRGRQVTGSALRFGFLTERFATRTQAGKRAAMFPVGAVVRVVHHPEQPGECVLEPRLEKGIYAAFAFGVALGISAVWMFAEVLFAQP